MLPDRVSNPGPQTYESGALPIALHSLANYSLKSSPKTPGPIVQSTVSLTRSFVEDF